MTETYWEWLTRVARTRAADDLRTGLLERMRSSRSFRGDPRDLMMVLAPVHHCAGHIEMEVAALFDEAADLAPPALAQTVRDFGRRDHGSPGVFGFRVEQTAEGPRYFAPGVRS
ncbi:MAG TPA: hypothetical protein VGL44_15550 [Gaiellales bacterium]